MHLFSALKKDLNRPSLSCVEFCAGGGGQAVGLERAGFDHLAVLEIGDQCCITLRRNRPHWNVIQGDLKSFDGRPYRGVDLVAAGLPCPPFSVAGKQLGKGDERNLFPAALRLIDEIRPKAVMIENVRGFLSPVFGGYRSEIENTLLALGYHVGWKLINAADYEVPQLRPRVVIVAIAASLSEDFNWPIPSLRAPKTVGETLRDLMASRGWRGAELWSRKANSIAPTIVGGSLKHGGPDLGPTRARQAWEKLGVDGRGIWDEPPAPDFVGMPRLTIPMVARLQGFPDSWTFSGKKTPAYRQVGNAFPPPVAKAVGEELACCLTRTKLVHLGASR